MANDPLPQISFNQTIYLSNPSSYNLQFVGGWILHEGGLKGIVVYRKKFDQLYDDFVSYERACPQHYPDQCGQLIVVDDIYLQCSCDNTHQYLLIDGQPLDGSQYAIRTYNTQFDGNNLIQVSN